MAGSVKVEMNLANLERIIKDLKKVKNLQCAVGIKEGDKYDSGIPVSEVATYLEYGWTQTVTARQSGWFMSQGTYMPQGATLRLPPRPTFHSTYETQNKNWLALGKRYLQGFCKAPYNKMHKALETMGELASEDVRACINTNGASNGTAFAPRSPLTMAMYAKKLSADTVKHKTDGSGSATGSKALRNDGNFANSIAFDITNE